MEMVICDAVEECPRAGECWHGRPHRADPSCASGLCGQYQVQMGGRMVRVRVECVEEEEGE